MHFHNSCTQNCDHHLLIMTGNAHKESCHKLLLILILVMEEGLNTIQTDCNGEMVVAFTITEINLCVKQFCDVVPLLSDLYLWY